MSEEEGGGVNSDLTAGLVKEIPRVLIEMSPISLPPPTPTLPPAPPPSPPPLTHTGPLSMADDKQISPALVSDRSAGGLCAQGGGGHLQLNVFCPH